MTSIDDALDLNCRNVIQRMGNRTTTSTSELQRYGDTYFPAGFFAGVHPADRAPPRSGHTEFYVQNIDPSDKPGTHWVAIARVPGHRDLLFDSFARPPSATFLPHLQGRVESTEDDVDQHPHDSTHCGQLCMAFGHILHQYGREGAKHC
jgi:hypothetical protein